MPKNAPLTRIDLPQLDTSDAPQIQSKFYNPFTGGVLKDNFFVEEISDIGIDISSKITARVNTTITSSQSSNIAFVTFIPYVPRIYFKSIIPDFVYFTIQFSLTKDFVKFSTIENILIVSSATELAPTFSPSVRLNKDLYSTALSQLLAQYTIEELLTAYGVEFNNAGSFFDKFALFINNSSNTHVYVRLRLSNGSNQTSSEVSVTQFYYPKDSASIKIQNIELENTNITNFSVDNSYAKLGLKFSVTSNNIKSMRFSLKLPAFNLTLDGTVDNMITGVNNYSVKFKELFYSGGSFSTSSNPIDFKVMDETRPKPYDAINRYLSSSAESQIEGYLKYLYGTTAVLSIIDITLVSGIKFVVNPVVISTFFQNNTQPVISITAQNLPYGSQLKADSTRTYFVDTFSKTLNLSAQIAEKQDADLVNVPENFVGILAAISVNSGAKPTYSQFIASDFLINKAGSIPTGTTNSPLFLKKIQIDLTKVTGLITKIDFYALSYWGLLSKLPLTTAISKQVLNVYSPAKQTITVVSDKLAKTAQITIKKNISKSSLPTIDGFLTLTDAFSKQPAFIAPLQIRRISDDKDSQLTLSYSNTSSIIRPATIRVIDIGDSYSIILKPAFMGKTYAVSMTVSSGIYNTYFTTDQLNTPLSVIL
jgi:hypothetical protein